jgi:hypothetical protein
LGELTLNDLSTERACYQPAAKIARSPRRTVSEVTVFHFPATLSVTVRGIIAEELQIDVGIIFMIFTNMMDELFKLAVQPVNRVNERIRGFFRVHVSYPFFRQVQVPGATAHEPDKRDGSGKDG